MKKVFLLLSVLVGILMVVSSCAAGVAQEDYDAVVAERDDALAQVTSLQAQVSGLQAAAEKVVPSLRVEVSRWGFNNIPGEFRLEVEAGQEVAITFVYGDEDLPQNNPHIIASPEHSIATGILDRDNPEVTLRFTAREAGEVVFMCVSDDCVGHHNLHTVPEG